LRLAQFRQQSSLSAATTEEEFDREGRPWSAGGGGGGSGGGEVATTLDLAPLDTDTRTARGGDAAVA